MAKNTLLRNDDDIPGVPPWMAKLRAMVTEHVKDDDIREIVQNQVKRAKEGDQKAIDFVFKNLLGGESLKGAHIVQNNFYGDAASPAKPTKALQGSPDKIEVMRRRQEAGLPLTDPADGNLDLS